MFFTLPITIFFNFLQPNLICGLQMLSVWTSLKFGQELRHQLICISIVKCETPTPPPLSLSLSLSLTHSLTHSLSFFLSLTLSFLSLTLSLFSLSLLSSLLSPLSLSLLFVSTRESLPSEAPMTVISYELFNKHLSHWFGTESVLFL